MAYAQTNYGQRVGTGPYTIADVGCFLTAFSNLLERFGEGIDPPTLNQYFIDHGVYSHDPSEAAGTADNLSWGSVSAYDGQISSTGINKGGWPNTNDAIVKFVFKSRRSGLTIPHFCLVADAGAHTIIDSYDGTVKHSIYGEPVEWVSYAKHAPQVVTPPPPAETPAFRVEGIPETTKQLKIDAKLWDMNRRSWQDMVNNPVGSAAAGTQFNTSQVAYHVLGGKYYLPDGNSTQGYNAVDCQDPVATPAPAPESAPAAPAPAPAPDNGVKTVEGVEFTAIIPGMKRMYISKLGGAEKWNFRGVKEWSGFKSVKHYDYGDVIYVSGSAYHPLGPRYEIDSNDWNGFDANGQPNNWYGFNKVDLSETRPAGVVEVASAAPSAPEPIAAPVITEPIATTAPIDWQASYKGYPAAKKLIAARAISVKDLSDQQKPLPLPAYDPTATPEQGVVNSFGTFFKDGIQYERIKTRLDADFKYWYGVPVVDSDTHTANLLPYPDRPAAPVTGAQIVGDLLQVSSSSLRDLLRVILPSWFNKKQK